jgi:hypothetical protein
MSNNGTLRPAVGEVLLAGKTPTHDQPIVAVLDGDLSVAEAFSWIADEVAPRSDSDRRLQQQLKREMSGSHDFFAMTAGSGMRKVEPKTALRELAVPREITRADGLCEKVPIVAAEVQAYADVGAGED